MELVKVVVWSALGLVTIVLALPWIGVVVIKYFDWVEKITEVYLRRGK